MSEGKWIFAKPKRASKKDPPVPQVFRRERKEEEEVKDEKETGQCDYYEGFSTSATSTSTATIRTRTNEPQPKLKQEKLDHLWRKQVKKEKVDFTTLEQYSGGKRSTHSSLFSPSSSSSSSSSSTSASSVESLPPPRPRPLPLQVSPQKKAIAKGEDEGSKKWEMEVKKNKEVRKMKNENDTTAITQQKQRIPYASSSTSTSLMKPKPARARDDFRTSSSSRDPNLDLTARLLEDFDKVPEKENEVTYKSVRKKADRAKLDGWDCDLCRQYYKDLEAEMHPAELQRLKNKCSRHKANRPSAGIGFELNNTPHEDYWKTSLPSTQEALERGLIKIGVPSPPVRRKRHDMLD